MAVNTGTVFVTFEPTDAMPCDPCDIERMDSLLEMDVADFNGDGLQDLIATDGQDASVSMNRCL